VVWESGIGTTVANVANVANVADVLVQQRVNFMPIGARLIVPCPGSTSSIILYNL
jgi:hypothetical protein